MNELWIGLLIGASFWPIVKIARHLARCLKRMARAFVAACLDDHKFPIAQGYTYKNPFTGHEHKKMKVGDYYYLCHHQRNAIEMLHKRVCKLEGTNPEDVPWMTI